MIDVSTTRTDAVVWFKWGVESLTRQNKLLNFCMVLLEYSFLGILCYWSKKSKNHFSYSILLLQEKCSSIIHLQDLWTDRCSCIFWPKVVFLLRAGVKSAAVLLPLLGVSWVFGLLTLNKKTIVFQYIFAFSSSFQVTIHFIEVGHGFCPQLVTKKKQLKQFNSSLHPSPHRN